MKDINLLPEEVNKEVAEKEENKRTNTSSKTIFLVVVVFLVVVFSYVLPIGYLKFVKYRTSQIQSNLNSKEFTEVKDIRAENVKFNQAISNKEKVLNDIDNKNIYMNDLLTVIEKATPKGCSVTSIVFNNNMLKIIGKADKGVIAAEFLHNMENLDNINAKSFNDGMDLKSIQEPNDFELTFSIEGKDEK